MKNGTGENPFEGPESETAPQPQQPKPIHPLVFVPILIFSVIVGGCTFVCTCIGLVLMNMADGSGFWFIIWTASFFAIVGSFWGIVALIRRSRRRAAEQNNQ